eukprot:CAMPEP_0117673324 /NCGR_PEP_ID=MMETSP0804-20121206/14409_1 /TAXON_ID=1074897 /ORGANISM="Tetraselmis astigmatica, Strain CCMP880" /LENGTH=300 /DNA_ID=CAMNT_0005482049 /DNA_START=237 /DNA_END=1139 /DNA_ORIENTATION=+
MGSGALSVAQWRGRVLCHAKDSSEDPDPVETTAAAPSPGEAKMEHAVEVEEYEEEEEELVQQVPSFVAQLKEVDYVGVGIKVGVVVAGVSFVIAMVRTVSKYLNPRAKRKRTVNKNKLLVDSLSELLPNRREELTPQTCKSIMFKTGFTGTEVFRKYLWFLLRERKFDQDAMADLVQLKVSLNLSDEQVVEAVKERSQRIYDKYGTLIMNAAGMTAEGATRKATGRALFSKLLYIAESDELISADSEAKKDLNVPEIFGATDRDASSLRIVSLVDVDIDRLDQMISGGQDDTTSSGEGNK